MILQYLTLLAILLICFYTWVLLRIFRLNKVPQLQQTSINVDCFEKSTVAVVIAARNEAKNVTACLGCMLSQKNIDQVVLVDDQSNDATLELAKKMAKTDDRLLVLSAPQLPQGWLGKSHALHYGATFVKTQYILFTDADVSFVPGTVSAAIHQMQIDNLDHLSGFFKIDCQSFGEKICAPVLAVSATIALSSSSLTVGSATGGFNMIKTNMYRNMGGHEQIRGAIVDDVHLARLARYNGAKTAFLDLSDNVNVRLFKGMVGFFSAVVRSTQSYLGNRRAIPLLGGISVLLTGILTVLLLTITWFTLFRSLPDVQGWNVASVASSTLSYTVGLLCVFKIRRYYVGEKVWALFYPLPVALLGMATVCSVFRELMGQKICWRGREYEV